MNAQEFQWKNVIETVQLYEAKYKSAQSMKCISRIKEERKEEENRREAVEEELKKLQQEFFLLKTSYDKSSVK